MGYFGVGVWFVFFRGWFSNSSVPLKYTYFGHFGVPTRESIISFSLRCHLVKWFDFFVGRKRKEVVCFIYVCFLMCALFFITVAQRVWSRGCILASVQALKA